MYLEMKILSEISQTQKESILYQLYAGSKKKNDTNKPVKQKNSDIERKLRVTNEGRGRDQLGVWG